MKLCKCVRFLIIRQEFSHCALHSFCRAISSSIDFVFLAELNQGLDVSQQGMCPPGNHQTMLKAAFKLLYFKVITIFAH